MNVVDALSEEDRLTLLDGSVDMMLFVGVTTRDHHCRDIPIGKEVRHRQICRRVSSVDLVGVDPVCHAGLVTVIIRFSFHFLCGSSLTCDDGAGHRQQGDETKGTPTELLVLLGL